MELAITGTELEVRLPEDPGLRSVSFRRSPAGTATARLTGDPEGEILVTRRGFTARSARPGVTLEVGVPEGLEAALITVGEGPQRRFRVPADGGVWPM